MKRMTIAAGIAILCVIAITCKRFYSLDDFLFEEEKLDKYLDPADLAEWPEITYCIPDSLIEPVTMTSLDSNIIYGFFVRGSLDSAVDRNITVLYCHGNSQNINRYWMRVEYLWKMGFNVFIFDYEGYGMSEGSPSGEALFSDGCAALDSVLVFAGVDTTNLIYYGMSLGSFVAVYLAAEVRHPKAMIIEAAPASIAALLKDSGLLELDGSYVADADFDNVKRIDRIGCPLLMMHSRDDNFIVFERHVPQLWDKALQPKDSLWVNGALHDYLVEVIGAEYDKAVLDFMNDHVLK